jgi:hypothetical protein
VTGIVDPTLPRDGTDLMTLQSEFLTQSRQWVDASDRLYSE